MVICRGVSNWRDADGNVPVKQTRDFKSLDHMNDVIVFVLDNFKDLVTSSCNC